VFEYAGLILSESKLLSSFSSLLDNSFHVAAFMVRTWAVWHRNRYVGGGLAIVWIGSVISSCVFVVLYSRIFVRMWLIISVTSSITIFAENAEPYEGFRGCSNTLHPNLFAKYNLKPLFIELCCVESCEYAEFDGLSCMFTLG
jgi:hypothetical protein